MAADPPSIDDELVWELITCSPTCEKPWSRWRWRQGRVYTCPCCRNRWTCDGWSWIKVMSRLELQRFERDVLGPHVQGPET